MSLPTSYMHTLYTRETMGYPELSGGFERQVSNTYLFTALTPIYDMWDAVTAEIEELVYP
jgi:hypothetical protein